MISSRRGCVASLVVALRLSIGWCGVALADATPPPPLANPPPPSAPLAAPPAEPSAASDAPLGGGAVDPRMVRGIDRQALAPGDPGREAAAGILYVPRGLVRLLFLTSGVAAGLVRDEQVVPRVEQLFSPRAGSYSVLPQVFLDSSRRASFGAQLLGNSRFAAIRLAVGFGGVHDLVGEARIRVVLPKPLPFAFTIEGLADTRSTLQYLGVGQTPDDDARNHFVRGAATHDALYFQERERLIFNLGARLGRDVEVIASSSLLRSVVDDTPGGGPDSIVQIFEPGTVAGAPVATPGTPPSGCADRLPAAPPAGRLPVPTACPVEHRLSYSELAVRFDTRDSKSRPSPGVLLEAYAGYASGVGGDPSRFYRFGGRAAGFASILRRTNILSPKIVIDGTAPPPSAPPVPFTELVNQPDFRGIDTRVDRLSAVYSLDYRWSMIRYLGPRLFVDMAQVGPNAAQLFKAPPRFAAGFGLDLFSDDTELAQAMMSFSAEGVRVLFSFGIPTQFGDRQHRR